jgi:hypothetical protein
MVSDLRETIILELLTAPSSGCTAVSRHAAERYADRILMALWGHAMAGILVLPHSHAPPSDSDTRPKDGDAQQGSTRE